MRLGGCQLMLVVERPAVRDRGLDQAASRKKADRLNAAYGSTSGHVSGTRNTGRKRRHAASWHRPIGRW
jgi:hypothetical protein